MTPRQLRTLNHRHLLAVCETDGVIMNYEKSDDFSKSTYFVHDYYVIINMNKNNHIISTIFYPKENYGKIN